MDPSDPDATIDVPPILAPICAVFRRHLKSCSLRYTSERAEVLAAVMDTEGLFDADSLLMEMRSEHKNVSKSTVYRTLRLLQDAGIVAPFMLLDAKITHYQLVYGREPSDYMVCVKTGKLMPLQCDDVVALREGIAADAGWETVGPPLCDLRGVARSRERQEPRCISPLNKGDSPLLCMQKFNRKHIVTSK